MTTHGRLPAFAAPGGPAIGSIARRIVRNALNLVVSVPAVHHLDGPGKADLFRRVAAVVGPPGRFVLSDVVVPEDAADTVTP